MLRSLCLLLCLLPSFPLLGAERLLITNVNVVDVAQGAIKANMTVEVERDRIVSVKASDTSIPPVQGESQTTINGSGKFLIPGLWDMHVHWYDEKFFPLFIANGVTGVRQMFGNRSHLKWRDQKAQPNLIPRHLVASPIFEGRNQVWEDSWVMTNIKEARRSVAKAHELKYDFVKVYSSLNRDVYFEIARESKRRGLSFEGHVPLSVTILEAVDAGQKSIEHMTAILDGCSRSEKEIKNERNAVYAKASEDRGISRKDLETFRRLNKNLLSTFDETKALHLFDALSRSGTFYCPTVTVSRAVAYRDDSQLVKDKRLSYIPRKVRAGWIAGLKKQNKFTSREDLQMEKKIYEKELMLIRHMQRAGVKILAGTDAHNPFCFPGFSLHDELSLLVQAGLSPLQALQTATLNPSQYAGSDKIPATIETGKIADLVLLDANPLQNITNTKRIAAVIFKGRAYNRHDLDQMLAKMKKQAGD